MTISPKKIAFTVCSFIMSVGGYAFQNPRPPEPQTLGTPPPPPGFPIDNGVMVLFAVALIYGIYKTIKLARD